MTETKKKSKAEKALFVLLIIGALFWLFLRLASYFPGVAENAGNFRNDPSLGIIFASAPFFLIFFAFWHFGSNLHASSLALLTMSLLIAAFQVWDDFYYSLPNDRFALVDGKIVGNLEYSSLTKKQKSDFEASLVKTVYRWPYGDAPPTVDPSRTIGFYISQETCRAESRFGKDAMVHQSQRDNEQVYPKMIFSFVLPPSTEKVLAALELGKVSDGSDDNVVESGVARTEEHRTASLKELVGSALGSLGSTVCGPRTEVIEEHVRQYTEDSGYNLVAAEYIKKIVFSD